MIKETYEVPENATVYLSLGVGSLPFIERAIIPEKITSTLNCLYVDTITEDELDFGEKGKVLLQLEKFEDQEAYSKQDKPGYDYLGEYLLYKGLLEEEPSVRNIIYSYFDYEVGSYSLNGGDPDGDVSFPVPLETLYVIAKVWSSPDGMKVYCGYIEETQLQEYQTSNRTNNNFSIQLQTDSPRNYLVQDSKLGFTFTSNPDYFGFNSNQLPIKPVIHDDLAGPTYAKIKMDTYQEVLICANTPQKYEVTINGITETHECKEKYLLIRISQKENMILVEISPTNDSQTSGFDRTDDEY